MDNSYDELKNITDEMYSGKRQKFAADVLKLLFKYGIKIRQKDGRLYQVNISIPKSRGHSILVGLRYIKKDETFTEDHFLFEKGKPINKFYKGKIELVLPEYKGTHKQQKF